jgi:hypothetical protein
MEMESMKMNLPPSTCNLQLDCDGPDQIQVNLSRSGSAFVSGGKFKTR